MPERLPERKFADPLCSSLVLLAATALGEPGNDTPRVGIFSKSDFFPDRFDCLLVMFEVLWSDCGGFSNFGLEFEAKPTVSGRSLCSSGKMMIGYFVSLGPKE